MSKLKRITITGADIPEELSDNVAKLISEFLQIKKGKVTLTFEKNSKTYKIECKKENMQKRDGKSKRFRWLR
jgi:hypothetical protein